MSYPNSEWTLTRLFSANSDDGGQRYAVGYQAMRREYLMLILTTFIWGSGHPIGKLILVGITPLQLSMLSSVLGALAVAVCLLLTKQLGNLSQLRGKGLGLALLSGGIMFFLYPNLSFSALQRIPASANAILVASSTIFVALLSPVLLKEKLEMRGYLAVLISFIGVSLVVLSTGQGVTDLSALNLFGCSLSLLGAIASASYTIIGRKAMSAYDALSVTLIGSVLGGILLGLVVSVTSGFSEIVQASVTTHALVAYWGIFSGLGYVMFYHSLKKLEATKASSFIYLSPLFALILSILILGESMTAAFVAGMALVFLGIWGTQKSRSTVKISN